MAENESFSGELSQDLSFFMNLSVNQLGKTSTPRKSRVTVNQSARSSPFKRPPERPKQNPVVAKCSQCGKEYRTIRYKTHLQGHTLKDIASRVPSQDSIMDLAPQVSADVLKTMESKPSVGLHAVEFFQLLGVLKTLENDSNWKEVVSLVCENFKDLLSVQLFCMPSSLIYTGLKIADNVLTSLSVRENILDKLQNLAPDMPNFSVDVLNSFLSEFVLTFVDKLVINVFRLLRDASTVKKVVFDEEERQAIYYIGGHICHKFKEMGYKYPKSKKWKIISEVIKTKFMETRKNDELNEQEKKDSSWTVKKDRGGLIKVTGSMQKFLLSAAEIVASHEQDGLPIEKILEKVVEGKPKYDWDSVVGNVMEESLSFSLMVGVVRSLINTYGNGILFRQMNEINKNKATASLTLRHRVAPKS